MRVGSCSLPELFFNDTVAGPEVAHVLELSCSKMRGGGWLVVLAFNTLILVKLSSKLLWILLMMCSERVKRETSVSLSSISEVVLMDEMSTQKLQVIQTIKYAITD